MVYDQVKVVLLSYFFCSAALRREKGKGCLRGCTPSVWKDLNMRLKIRTHVLEKIWAIIPCSDFKRLHTLLKSCIFKARRLKCVLSSNFG